MHSIRIHRVITQVISALYRVGFWHRGDQPTARERAAQAFYCFYHSLFVTSLAVGAIKNGIGDESIFLWESSLVVLVLDVKFWTLIRKQKQILDLLNRIAVFSIRAVEDFTFFNRKLERFMNVLATFLFISFFACVFASVVPFFSSERKMLLDFAFPFDWRNNEMAFWIAYTFINTETFVTYSVLSFIVIIWYLMLHCSLRYEVLGRDIRNMGRINEQAKGKLSQKEMHQIFRQDLDSSIDAHRHLKALIDELLSFVSKLFLLQFGTSALCICGSIFCLAFDIGDNIVERTIHVYSLFFHISELFMITYFGNEIMLSSDRLSYMCFESNWVEQPLSTKKDIVFFGEYLKQPHVLLIGKLYPLTLKTFTRILKSAYSFFNVIKSTQQ